jgi:3-phosphoshikimate 1-carboxyvinyltransferase
MNIQLQKARDVDLTFTAPPSKSYTHRALIIASLAGGQSRIVRPLKARDTMITCRALRSLGAEIGKSGDDLLITGNSGTVSCGEGLTLDMENSGTSLRLLTTLTLLCNTGVIVTGNPRMQERPVGALVTALNQLGGRIGYQGRTGFPPLLVEGLLKGGKVTIPGEISSQFISSLMIAGPYALSDVEITVTGKVASRSYLDLTCDCMKAFGVKPGREGYRKFTIRSGDRYQARDYTIEGDYSSASYFFAIAAACGGRVRVTGLNPVSVQGDRAFLDALGMMGCRVHSDRSGVVVESPEQLRGITIDMSSSPDTVQTLCMLAALADSASVITGISHLKYKESDRLQSTADIINGLGGKITVTGDSVRVSPSPLHAGTVDPKDDHRTAMSAAVLALSNGNIVINNAECVDKSFPGFWDELKKAGLC